MNYTQNYTTNFIHYTYFTLILHTFMTFQIINKDLSQYMKMNFFIIMICAYTGFTMFLKWITTEDNFTGFQKFDNSSHIVNNKYSHLNYLTY